MNKLYVKVAKGFEVECDKKTAYYVNGAELGTLPVKTRYLVGLAAGLNSPFVHVETTRTLEGRLCAFTTKKAEMYRTRGNAV